MKKFKNKNPMIKIMIYKSINKQNLIKTIINKIYKLSQLRKILINKMIRFFKKHYKELKKIEKKD